MQKKENVQNEPIKTLCTHTIAVNIIENLKNISSLDLLRNKGKPQHMMKYTNQLEKEHADEM